MEKGKFFIESLEGNVFEGYTEKEDWNGWSCPYFTFEEASKIAIAQKQIGVDAYYEDKQDEFIFNIQGEREIYGAVFKDDMKLYPVGNSNWIWEEISTVK